MKEKNACLIVWRDPTNLPVHEIPQGISCQRGTGNQFPLYDDVHWTMLLPSQSQILRNMKRNQDDTTTSHYNNVQRHVICVQPHATSTRYACQ